jgi:ubiquinone/menaquinone biosynthesis C-methylase UbiE
MNLRVIPCTDCHKFDFCKQYEDENRKRVDKAGVWVGCQSPIRKCQHAIIDLHFAFLSRKNVLEVGCGSSKKGGFIKQMVEKNGNRWTGIDLVKTDLTSYVCDVTNMPFADGSFDTVIGNQTMEHWPNVPRALGEIYRVLETGGRVYLNVPIHLHETKDFVLGDLASH